MQDFVPPTCRSRYLPPSRGAQLTRRTWFELAPVLTVLAALEHLCQWALAAARALPFNTSLNPTAFTAALIRETLL
jgi:hypothetical protein